jgi:methanogenic corrinoid protein MtbC1
VHELENACTENQIVIDQLIKCMVAFDEWQFEKIINSAINRLGFKAVLLEMLYPFLEKIGILWMTGNISPAQEHFISNIIRQKIIVAIDGQHVQPHTAQKKIIMFLPQNEFHELSLLFFNYYFKTQQQHIIYLGANVPYADMQQVIDVYHPDYLFTVLTSSIYIKPTTQMLTNLANKNQSIKLMVAGAQVCHLRHAALPNLHCFTSLQEVLQFKP